MSYWLVKSEPNVYSFDDLVKEKQTVWSGVRNYAARIHLKAMKKGDEVLFYHSNEGMEIVGIKKDPRLVLHFYNMRRKDVAAALPNAAHTGLAELEKDFDVTIVTQNIDDLHERGGSTNVVHLHGEIFKMRSIADENRTYEIRE